MNERAPLSQVQREAALKDIVGSDLGAIVEAAKLLSSDRSTTATLLKLLETERRVETRQGLLYALCWHGDLGTWDLMIHILADPQEAPKVRGQAAEGLSYMFMSVRTDSREFEAAVHALRGALKDPSPEVRYCAVNALGATGHPPLIPVLQAMGEDRTPVPGWMGTVSEEASRAIEALEGLHRMRLKNGR
ncbi:HEAT repeat domain-containing protein [Corallococcus sp. bb12-1]|uniref:HEAT repeat domain-containing protein n=1 Tax=Corallococcus sp. bb12-1 TaxID=2996784 RepID=UPI002270BE13|nr:HEAT repeat domain-containing protein [Corallococcus sp. bb12-1]MCY1042378.1 HEAT repeat domain-containing protein [Corallococcus sp. bb12-1]